MFMYFPIAFFRQVLTSPGCCTQEFISFEVLTFTLGFLMLGLLSGQAPTWRLAELPRRCCALGPLTRARRAEGQ